MGRGPQSQTVPRDARRGLDKRSPKRLVELQTWFAGALMLSLSESERLCKIACPDASRFIAPGATLSAHRRIEIYHQQYWWRLLRCLHENFPFLTRLFGYRNFNSQIAIPYLTYNPPTHWALSRLGDTLPAFLQEHYTHTDKALIIDAATLDAAAQHAFLAPHFRPLKHAPHPTQKLFLQPHIHLFHLKADLFAYREAFLKENVDHWNTHPFPPLPPGKHFLLYRNSAHTICWKELTPNEYLLLHAFQNGATLTEACQQLQGNDAELLPLWFQEWTLHGFLTHRGVIT